MDDQDSDSTGEFNPFDSIFADELDNEQDISEPKKEQNKISLELFEIPTMYLAWFFLNQDQQKFPIFSKVSVVDDKEKVDFNYLNYRRMNFKIISKYAYPFIKCDIDQSLKLLQRKSQIPKLTENNIKVLKEARLFEKNRQVYNLYRLLYGIVQDLTDKKDLVKLNM